MPLAHSLAPALGFLLFLLSGVCLVSACFVDCELGFSIFDCWFCFRSLNFDRAARLYGFFRFSSASGASRAWQIGLLMRWGAGRSCPGRYWMLCLLLLALATPASRAGQRGLLLRWGLGHRAVEAIGRFACFCLLWLFLLRGHGKLVCSCAGVLGSIFGRDLTFCFSLLAVSGAASDCWPICLLLRWGSEFAVGGRYWLPCVHSSSHRSFHHCRHYHFHYHRLSHHRRHHHSDHIHCPV